MESLEQRLLPAATPVAALVSPGWFEDLSSPAVPLYAGSAGWSASSSDQEAASAGSDSNTCDWIVRFNTSAMTGVSSVAQTASLLVGSGAEFQVLRGLGLVGQVLVRSTGASAGMVQSVLASNGNVAGFERDAIHQFDALPNDPQVGQLWGLENSGQNGGLPDADIDASAAWGISTGSSNVVVAVVDTGVDWRHSDLAANIWTNAREVAGNGVDDDGNGLVDDVHGYNFAGNTGDPMDDNGHGTHVAGTIAAVGNNGVGVSGINWAGSIMPLKFLGADGSGYTSDAIRAINYATMERTRFGVNVRAINMSWGGGGYSAALGAAIQAAGEAGILCVAAAGNSGRNNDTSPQYPSSYDASGLLAVAATDNRDNLASFSNYGATSVDLAAPGVSILSTYPNNRYVSLSGTSMATPHVAGVAALAWSVAPNATVAEIKNAILGGVDRIAGLSGKVATGGRLNAYNTLRLLNTPTPRPPEIGSLAVSAGSLTAGSLATLTARGVTDPDGSVSGVWFYQDSNNNGQWDAADRVLGSTSTIAGQQASMTLNTAGYAPGTYRVFARAQDSSALWSTAVSTTFQVVAADDYGNNAQAAAAVNVGSTVAGQIETGGDRDWFKVNVVAGRKYTFCTQLTTLQDSVLTLYGTDGAKKLAYNDDAPGRGLASQIDWTASATGTYYLEVKAYAGSQTGAYSLTLRGSVTNTAPVLSSPGDRTMPVRQDAITVQLNATDVEGDRLTYTAEVLPSNSLSGQAYDLDQRLGLYSTGNYLQNLRGGQEKWMRGAGNKSYYVLPNGELHQWTGRMSSSPLVATLSSDYWANPRLLHDAQPAPSVIPAGAVSLGLQGSALTINPRDGLLGQFQVRVTVSDGVYTDTETFKVTVTNNSSIAASLAGSNSGAIPLAPQDLQAGDRALMVRAIDQFIGRPSAGQGDADRAPAAGEPLPSNSSDACAGNWHEMRLEGSAAGAGMLDGLASQPRTTDRAGISPSQAGSLRSMVLAQVLDEHRTDCEDRVELAGRILDELSALFTEGNPLAPEGLAG
jgi:subtilisin family serine protease